MKIKILDSPMGSGKTTYLIDYMNKNYQTKEFIYITPFLNEINRIRESVMFDLNDPKAIGGSKLTGLKNLVFKKKNIISTHALFSRIDSDLIKLLQASNYTLLLDEVADVIEELNVSKQDISILFQEQLISVDDENGKVTWLDEDYVGEFSYLKELANQNSLFLINDVFMVWCLPIEIFNAFDEVIISTYQFNYQLQCYYYQYFDVEFEYFHVENNELVKTVDDNFDKNFREKAKKLITICDNEKLNAIGDSQYALSKTWYSKASEYELKLLKRHLGNYRRKISSGDKFLWTTFKDYRSKLKDKGYAKSFIPLNSRATNDYGGRNVVMYCCNRFVVPYQKHFFAMRNIKLDEDGYALSEMLQFIWRSAIRNGEPIEIYIPSKRMRELLIKYLNNEI